MSHKALLSITITVSLILFSRLIRCQTALSGRFSAVVSVQQVGNAEVSNVVAGREYDPLAPPAIYWHDPQWQLDMVPLPSLDSALSVSIQHNGRLHTVTLPENYEQIDSILRNPTDKAIVVISDHTGGRTFIIIDLNNSTIIDTVEASFILLSPNRRFLLFKNWSPNRYSDDDFWENQYRIYDTEATATQNICGYSPSDPQKMATDDSLRGRQIYPPTVPTGSCSLGSTFGSQNTGIGFIWSADSNKVAFVDFQGDSATLVAVFLSVTPTVPPITRVYPLRGTENPCGSAAATNGIAYCDPQSLRDILWSGNSIKAQFISLSSPSTTMAISVPLSSFVAPTNTSGQ
jgi:hypothetical protein